MLPNESFDIAETLRSDEGLMLSTRQSMCKVTFPEPRELPHGVKEHAGITEDMETGPQSLITVDPVGAQAKKRRYELLR
jgi:hypothetical protein